MAGRRTTIPPPPRAKSHPGQRLLAGTEPGGESATRRIQDQTRTACRLDGVTFERIVSRAMSLPREIERQRLDVIADDLREAFHERGHRVDVALDADPAFGTGRSRSSLMSELVMDAVSQSASQVGVYFQPVNGTGRELVGERHRYRIRRARRDTKQNLIVTVSSESTLGVEEEPTLFPMENWIFGWITDADGLIAEVFIAEILGIQSGSPGRLLLAEALVLGSDGPLGGGFNPSEEELDLGLDDEGDADSLGA